MDEYWQLLGLIAPVFMMIGLGVLVRRVGVFNVAAEGSLLKIVVKVFYPCLIFRSVLDASSLDDSSNIWAPPVVGFSLFLVGMFVGWLFARLVGYTKGAGLRTFCFSIGVFNYGYIPIPLTQGLYGNEVLAILFVFNVGLEFGIWTIGVSFVSGASLREGIKKALNPAVFALCAAVVVNQLGGQAMIPQFLEVTIGGFAACAIPIGLLVIGATFNEFFEGEERVFEWKTSVSSVLLRLGLIPLVMLGVAMLFPFSDELKKVIVIQSAMPAGIMPIALAKHYNGQPIVAFRIVVATTLVALLAIPLWIRIGDWLVFS